MIRTFFMELQDSISEDIEKCDGKAKFKEEMWERPGGGGGRTRIIENGDVIEKGGVNFSSVHGPLSEKVAKGLNVESGQDFLATGVSVIMHPKNPMVPIIHMNVRYFEIADGTCWFGGGIDLTPIFINIEEAKYFHQYVKFICDKHHPSYYPTFKTNADDYFFIKHRNETRGIGGIFFDKLKSTEEISIEDRFAFTKDVGLAFSPIYSRLIQDNRDKPYGEKQKQWQLVRRGRYAEFNLVCDRGTKFGLDTNGRIESILMSLPPEVNWLYNYQATEPNEIFTQSMLKKDIDWIQM
ncbi:oxygen-dependent coproporphyrinogen oxidase [Bacillus sp. FJAT-49736]|uniref:oxygen-dependent coproporphyrinogen oxidase n=1 Tax=Bacillus sp. FJAT-49736 TaxID=2833582 RepID=UPI001BC9B35C|nr:oxygen-dependent coproporphyrinogen oxidase [Bacillus sp. FJAT-49736]MBS4174850.1 oxygen-dependent coproporphyrinogen oxidase [Bacillus sp. FJAT-49736]